MDIAVTDAEAHDPVAAQQSSHANRKELTRTSTFALWSPNSLQETSVQLNDTEKCLPPFSTSSP
jgi:hypothetical protein